MDENEQSIDNWNLNNETDKRIRGEIEKILDEVENFTKQTMNAVGNPEFLEKLRQLARQEESSYYKRIGEILGRGVIEYQRDKKVGVSIYDLVIGNDARNYVACYLDKISQGASPEDLQEEEGCSFPPPSFSFVELCGIQSFLLESHSLLSPSIEAHRRILEDALDEKGRGESAAIKNYDEIFRIAKKEILNTEDFLSSIFY